MPTGERTLKVVLAGDAKGLSRAFDRAGGSASKFGKAIGGAAKVGAAAIAGLGVAAVGAGVAAFKIGESFDQAYDTIIAGTNASGDQLEGLKDQFRDVVSSVPADFDDAATAIADLNTRLGISGDELGELSADFLELSRVTDIDVGTAIAEITRMFGDWGVATDDQALSLDKLLAASQASGATIDELAKGVVNFGAPLRQLGFNMDEAIAMFAKFEVEGVNTEAIMAGLKQGLGKMAAAGKDPIDAWAEVTQKIQEAGSMGDAVGIAIETFGQRAGPDLAAAIREGRFELDGMLDVIAGSEGTLDETADATRSFGESWKMFKNKILVGLEPIATKVFDGLGDLMDKLGPKVQPVIDWFSVHLPEAVAFLGEKWEEWFPRIQEVVAGVVEWIRENFPAIRDKIVEVVEAVVGFIKDNWPEIEEIISSVMETVKAVIDTAVSAITTIWDKWGEDLMAFVDAVWPPIREIITSAMNTIREVIETVMALIKGDWDEAWDSIYAIVQEAWDTLVALVTIQIEAIKLVIKVAVDLIKEILKLAWDAITSTASSAWEGIKAAISAPIEALRDFVSGMFDEIVDTVMGAPARILEAVGDFLQAGLDIGNAIMQGVIDGIGGMVEALGDAAASIGTAIWGAAKEGLNMIIRAWNGLSFKFPEFSGDWNGPLPGGGFTLGGWTLSVEGAGLAIKEFADGGFVRAGSPVLGLIGEGGDDEVVSPVPTLEKTMRGVLAEQAAGPTVINVNVNGAQVGPMGADELAAEIDWAMSLSGMR